MGGPGVFRSFNFVKNLPSLGYKPIVLTIKEKDIRKSRYPIDESLLAMLPPEIEIVRVSPREPKQLKRFLMQIRLYKFVWTIFYPLLWETSAFWPFLSFFSARRLIREHNIKIIYTTSGPFSSLLLGFMLKKSLSIKWVADIRDPFTESFGWLWPSKLHWRFCRLLERVILKQVDSLVVVTPEMKKLYVKRNIVPETRITVITNGF